MDHTDLNFTRDIAASPQHVYHCLTDPAARQIWNSPDAEAIFVVTSNTPVAPGQRETGQVGPKDNPYVTAHADWIVTQPGETLVYAETLEAEGMTLSTSLACVSLAEKDGLTVLTLHVHVTSFTGAETIQEVTEGWGFAVDAVAGYAASS